MNGRETSRRLFRLVAICGFAFILAATVGCTPKEEPNPLKKQYKKALREPDPTARAYALLKVAKKYNKGGDIVNRDAVFADVAKAAGKVKAPEAACQIYNKLAYALAKAGSPTEATNAIREAEKATERMKKAEDKIHAYSQIAVTYGTYLKKKPIATIYIKKAEGTARKLKAPDIKAPELAQIGYAYYRMGQKDEAKKLIREAFEVARSIDAGDLRARCDAIRKVAAQQISIKEVAAAKENLAEATQLAKKIQTKDNPGRDNYAHAIAEIARQYHRAGDNTTCKELLDLAKGRAQQITDPGQSKETLRIIGSYYP